MRRIALAALLLMALQAFPASAAVLPVDTNPLGTLTHLPNGTDQAEEVADGAERMIVLFDHSISQMAPLGTGNQNVPLLATGDFAVRFTGGALTTAPLPGLMVGHHPALDDVKSAADGAGIPGFPGFPQEVSDAVSGVAGYVPDGKCSAGVAPTLFAYSKTTTSVTAAKPVAGPCTVITSTQRTDLQWANVIKTYTPGFWVDLEILDSGSWEDEAWMYKAVYDTATTPEGDGDFWTTVDAAGTGTWLSFP